MTDEERREIAARLRWIDAKDDPGNAALMLDKIRRAIGVHMDATSVFPPYEWLVTYAHVTLNHLADLIEPEERTCHNISSVPCKFTCSECHQSWREAKGNGAFAFCPNCGAKVIQE